MVAFNTFENKTIISEMNNSKNLLNPVSFKLVYMCVNTPYTWLYGSKQWTVMTIRREKLITR